MLQLDSVSRTFLRGSTEIRALRSVTLQIHDGETVAVQGPSGSGKTTFLSLVGTLDRPTTGTIRIDGEDVWTLSDPRRARLRARKIGFVFQAFNLIPELPAWKNVAIPLRYAGVRYRERKRRAMRALAEVGLQERTLHLPSQLSGGEEQRVAIARSMVIKPHLLLADEPTGNLDSATGNEIMDHILSLQENESAMLIIVTHDDEVADRCPRRVELLDGRLVRSADK